MLFLCALQCVWIRLRVIVDRRLDLLKCNLIEFVDLVPNQRRNEPKVFVF